MPPICVNGTCDKCCPCSTLCHSNRFCRELGRFGISKCHLYRYRAFSVAIFAGFIQLLLCIYCACALSPDTEVLDYTYWGLWSAVNESLSMSNTTSTSIPENFEIRMGITHVAFDFPNRTEWSVNWEHTCEGAGKEQKWLSLANLCGQCEEEAYSLRFSVVITVATSLTKMRVNYNRRDPDKDLPIWKFLGIISCLVINACTMWSYHLLVHHCFEGMSDHVGTYELSWEIGPGIFAELVVLVISMVNGFLHVMMPVPEVNLWCNPADCGSTTRHQRLLTLDSNTRRKMLLDDYSNSYAGSSDV